MLYNLSTHYNTYYHTQIKLLSPKFLGTDQHRVKVIPDAVQIKIIGRRRTPVREAFSYGIRNIHCDLMKYDLMLHKAGHETREFESCPKNSSLGYQNGLLDTRK